MSKFLKITSCGECPYFLEDPTSIELPDDKVGVFWNAAKNGKTCGCAKLWQPMAFSESTSILADCPLGTNWGDAMYWRIRSLDHSKLSDSDYLLVKGLGQRYGLEIIDDGKYQKIKRNLDFFNSLSYQRTLYTEDFGKTLVIGFYAGRSRN